MNSIDMKAIDALDLEPIKVKLMHVESGEGWTLERANAVEVEYRRFLHLMKLFPHEQTAPLMEVDIFWHYHILDTMKYAADCEAVFGHFLHHFPYIGLRGEDDAAAHVRVGLRMQELYEATFGEPYLRDNADAAATAYSGMAVEATAYSGMAVQARTAYSGMAVPAKTAYSGMAVQAKTAYSGMAVPAKTAYSGMAIQAGTAYSGMAVTAAAKADAAIGQARLSSFYSDRPRLNQAG